MTKEDDEKAQEEAKQKAEEEAKVKADADAAEKIRAEGEANANAQSPLEEARALDKSIKEGNAETKKLLDRQEKLQANAQIAGKGFAAPNPAPQMSDEELAARKRIKAVADASGASWGKKYE